MSLIALDGEPAHKRVISSDSADSVEAMLEGVVRPGGTGTKAKIPGYRVAGKTGTAWKFAAGGYSKDKYISIFAGLVPASNPRLAVVVVIDEPSGDLYYGSDVAAPVFASVMTESLRLMAVPPDDLPENGSGRIMQAMSK
jgi:cell division protein FtsI (penicillin-binding protein 3)